MNISRGDKIKLRSTNAPKGRIYRVDMVRVINGNKLYNLSNSSGFGGVLTETEINDAIVSEYGVR